MSDNNRPSVFLCFGVCVSLVFGLGLFVGSDVALAKEKVKVLYHVDGKDLGTAKYAMALINKHGSS